MKFYSLRRIETFGIERFSAISVNGGYVRRANYPGTERIGVECFISLKQAVSAGKTYLSQKIAECGERTARLEAQLAVLNRQEVTRKSLEDECQQQ